MDVVRTGLDYSLLRWYPVADFCELGNELSGSKCERFIEWRVVSFSRGNCKKRFFNLVCNSCDRYKKHFCSFSPLQTYCLLLIWNHLFQVQTSTDDVVPEDVYRLSVGIRKMEWNNESLKINGKQIYIRGFGRHEDSAVGKVQTGTGGYSSGSYR